MASEDTRERVEIELVPAGELREGDRVWDDNGHFRTITGFGRWVEGSGREDWINAQLDDPILKMWLDAPRDERVLRLAVVSPSPVPASDDQVGFRNPFTGEAFCEDHGGDLPTVEGSGIQRREAADEGLRCAECGCVLAAPVSVGDEVPGSVGMTVQELAEALEGVDGDLAVVMPPQPNEPDGNMGFRVTGYSVGADHVTLHVQGVRRG